MSSVNLDPYPEKPNQVKRPGVTTVQMNPIQALPDMTAAIRRQRRTGLISYSKDPFPLSKAKPAFRDQLSGSIQTGNASSPYSDSFYDGEPGVSVYGLHGNSDNMFSTSNSVTGPANSRNKIAFSPASFDNGFYRPTHDKQGKLATVNFHSSGTSNVPQGFTEINGASNSRQVVKTSRLAHSGRAHSVGDYSNVYNFSTGDPFLPCTKDDILQAKSKRFLDGNIGELKSEHEKPIKGFTALMGSSKIREGHSWMPPRDSAGQVLARALPKDSAQYKSRDTGEGSVQSPNATHSLSFVQFADSVIDAVEDLDLVYQLCQSKLGYAEVIELSEPHRLVEKRIMPDDKNQSYGFRELSPSLSSISSSRSSITRVVNSLPYLPVKAKLNLPPQNEFDSTFDSALRISREVGEVYRDRRPLARESDLDYEKPVRIINDSDGKIYRSILKSTVKAENTTDGNNNSVPSYLAVKHAVPSNTWKNTHDSYDYKRDLCSGEMTNSELNNKGRLVRLSADHKIHEFLPLEPLNSNDDFYG